MYMFHSGPLKKKAHLKEETLIIPKGVVTTDS